MPTGYTDKLMEKGQTFNEFIMCCAKAFGACVTMRDSPFDAPIPEKFEPTDYHEKKIKEARKALQCLTKLSDEKKIAFGQKEKDKKIKEHEQYIKKETDENARLRNMRNQVANWNPPTKEHEGLKRFMLEQIDISMNDTEYFADELKKAQRKTAIEYYGKAVSDATRDISYHEKEHAAEIERVNGRNEWLRLLRESI